MTEHIAKNENEYLDKESVKEFVCKLIDCLDEGTFIVNGIFNWDTIDIKIKKSDD